MIAMLPEDQSASAARNRHGIVVAATLLLLVVSLIVIMTTPLLGSPLLHPASGVPPTPRPLAIPQIQSDSAVARENALPGTSAWELDPHANQFFIQGYADQVSAQPGDEVHLYVSAVTAVQYQIQVYRIGWYGGLGGRLLTTMDGMIAKPQGYWSYGTGLVGCASCLIDPTTHLIDARWQVSATLAIGADWVSGVYLIKLVAANNDASYIPLIIRDDASTSAVVANLPVDTWQAYSVWGDYSLYGHFIRPSYALIGGQRATKISFNRPYDRGAGTGDFLSWDIHVVRWLERSGLDVSYTTDVDLHENPATLLRHRVLVDIGHDEYWTMTMRDGIQAALDHGVSLAFLGADDAYWQARMEPDAAGAPDRTLVCYKVESARINDPTARPEVDPMFHVNRLLTTAQFRDPIVNMPENALLGEMYSSIVERTDGGRGYKSFDWVVSDGPPDALLLGTGLTPGEHIKNGLQGYEYDRTFNNGVTPKDLVILAASPVTSYQGTKDVSYTSYYRAPSGALVFDAGTVWWGWGLDDFTPPDAPQSNILHGNQAIANLTSNLMQAMLAASPPPAINASPTPVEAPTPSPTLPPLP